MGLPIYDGHTDFSPVAAVIFYIDNVHFLPQVQPEKAFRWDYDYVDRGDKEPSHSLKRIDTKLGHELDEWAIGVSSSISSGTLSPSDECHSWDDETLGSGSSDTEFDV